MGAHDAVAPTSAVRLVASTVLAVLAIVVLAAFGLAGTASVRAAASELPAASPVVKAGKVTPGGGEDRTELVAFHARPHLLVRAGSSVPVAPDRTSAAAATFALLIVGFAVVRAASVGAARFPCRAHLVAGTPRHRGPPRNLVA